jgi:hypothetical protein
MSIGSQKFFSQISRIVKVNGTIAVNVKAIRAADLRIIRR